MKRIVLLSDGTGNGAAKRHKTNVWRLYDALDLQREDQIAMYDDGVGSQQFLLFKLLGGAFGWGLKRNVIELYMFLCRNYCAGDSVEESDRIYLFGFSRGAFTVRVLAGLIAACGLCTGFRSDRELHAMARANYETYRKKYDRWRLSTPFAWIRDRLRNGACTVGHAVVRPQIAFVGVWDTVDAYGLPVDELVGLWDRFIFPLRFKDGKLSKQVLKACHALSIDDERHTFHPVLWDESTECSPGCMEDECKECVAGRIEQVWFPGVHSDVGGGYPRHGLALVSLDWMISKVEASAANPLGLTFLSHLREEYARRCDWSGIQHDSRAGLRAFYRYKPRSIEILCRRAGATGGKTGLAKIHGSVFERIREKVVPYAPTGLPARYDIETTRETMRKPESGAEGNARAEAMNFALDVIYWRRWLYRVFVAITLLLVASPILVVWEAGVPCAGLGCVLDPLWNVAGGVVPEFALGWVEALRQNPGWFGSLALLYAALSVLKTMASAKTAEHATAAWSAVKASGHPPAWHQTPTSRLRAVSAGAVGRAARKTWWWIVFLVVLTVMLVTADRLLLHVRDSAGWLCGPSPEVRQVSGQEAIEFDTATPCLPAAVELVAGTTYRFDVAVRSDWMDGDLRAGPDGLAGTVPVAMKAATPFRRHLSRPWFELTGRVGQSGGETFSIGSGTCYTAKSGGALYLYVNDAVSGLMPGAEWAFPYRWSPGRNKGAATVNVAAVGKGAQCDRSGRCERCASESPHAASGLEQVEAPRARKSMNPANRRARSAASANAP